VSNAIVPEEVIVPPVNPVPAINEVTVPTDQLLFADKSNVTPFIVSVLDSVTPVEEEPIGLGPNSTH
jgi:hypothetical protein